jgi:hypothetical protein
MVEVEIMYLSAVQVLTILHVEAPVHLEVLAKA